VVAGQSAPLAVADVIQVDIARVAQGSITTVRAARAILSVIRAGRK